MGLRVPSASVAALLLASSASAFVAPSLRSTTPPSTSSARHFGVDPSAFHDLPHHYLTHAFNTFNLADLDADSAVAASDAVSEVVKQDPGWFGFLTEPIALLLQAIHAGLSTAGMSENSWGVSIVALTVLIKLVTFPLTKTQLESTNKMQVRTCTTFVKAGGNKGFGLID
jgi:YidC/Oxa1 family membrane protein insertase